MELNLMGLGPAGSASSASASRASPRRATPNVNIPAPTTNNSRINNLTSKITSSNINNTDIAEGDSNNNATTTSSLSSSVERKHFFFVPQEGSEIFGKVRSVLNKVSSVNYNRLRDRWLDLMPSATTAESDPCASEPRLALDQIPSVVHLVIAKALEDTIYMHIYVGLIGYVILKKDKQVSALFKSQLKAQLQREMKKLTTDKELATFHQSQHILAAARRRKVALHRFIAELYCEKAIGPKFLLERVTDIFLLRGSEDEGFECLCVLMTYAGEKLETEKGRWVNEIFARLEQGATNNGNNGVTVSKRIQFMILDLVEMRGSGWSPHNKWWSPSVQRPTDNRQQLQTQQQQQIERQRTTSESESHSLQQQSQQLQHHPIHSIQPLTSPATANVSSSTAAPGRKQGRSRTRTRSEGSPLSRRQEETQEEQEQQQQLNLNPNQSRALMALLNKVTPHNVSTIAAQLNAILGLDPAPSILQASIAFIVDKVLDDSFYARTNAYLVYLVDKRLPGFGAKVGNRLLSILQEQEKGKGSSRDGFQLLAELYNLNLVEGGKVFALLEKREASLESLAVFLFIAGGKLDGDEERRVSRLLEFWQQEKKEELKGRSFWLMQDLLELQGNKWVLPPNRPMPQWIPQPQNHLTYDPCWNKPHQHVHQHHHGHRGSNHHSQHHQASAITTANNNSGPPSTMNHYIHPHYNSTRANPY